VAQLASVVGTAIGAFVVTNIDDFVVLLLLILGMPLDGIRRWQIVIGQYLGFCVLLVISGFGALALRAVSENWAGLLGVVPLALGIRGLIRAGRGSAGPAKEPIIAGTVARVAVVTVANGGDNVSVYVLLFRQLNITGTAVTVLVFLVSLGVLCAAALLIGQHTPLIPGIIRGNRWLTPSVFVMIGALLLIRTGAIAHVVGAAHPVRTSHLPRARTAGPDADRCRVAHRGHCGDGKLEVKQAGRPRGRQTGWP
jgi:cadmium resistance protein CadD (predicted permease)